ncbi:hypothetical protein [Wolbachia endosymbiont of Aedes albopictus]|uniref:hypothetical protein n=1 Tax=Wolbachia endosymbiont of Aedes albopictus TaxID=167957 RepID=UPI000BBC5CF3|nr:hypothetical protein [Wolbachia endosymbiont of Aedes albopictus]UVW84153.1 hypothetical protein NHG98_01375 [Wolbachia endosymbiont of Aedes albopictus]
MNYKIQLKKVTDYEVHEHQGYKHYRITSKKNLDPDSHERNYYVGISPEVQGMQEEPTGLYNLRIAKDFNGSGYIDYIDIRHLNLVREPEYNEQSRTVNAELEFAQTSEPTQVFSHNYGGSSLKEFIDISMDLI